MPAHLWGMLQAGRDSGAAVVPGSVLTLVLLVSVEVVVIPTTKHPPSGVHDRKKDALEKPCG